MKEKRKRILESNGDRMTDFEFDSWVRRVLSKPKNTLNK